jgi:phage-related protein
VKYRTAGQTSWTTVTLKAYDSTTTTPPQTETPTNAAITITDAVEIAIGIEPQEAQPAGLLTLSGAITIALSQTPTVTINIESTARLIDAVLTNITNGQFITFNDVYMDDVEMSIDCLRKTIGTVSGPWFGTITFVNPDDWFSLNVGNNVWSWSAGTYNMEFVYPERYLI